MTSISPTLSKIRDISNNCLDFLDKQSIPMLEALNIWLRLMLLKQWADQEQNQEIQSLEGLSSYQAWTIIKSCSQEIGKTINRHLQLIEQNNPVIPPILADSIEFRWDRYVDSVLKKVIEQIALINLRNEDKQELGKVIEEILDEKALKHQEVGQYWIPSSIIQLMMVIVDPILSWPIYCPLCGIGRFFGEFLRQNQGIAVDSGKYHLYGQESSLNVYTLAWLYLGVQGFLQVNLDHNDVIKQPIVNQGKQLEKFEAVFSVLPMSGEYWGEDTAKYDPYKRFPYGLPRKDQGDWAYIQHILASLTPEGMAVVTVSPNALYRDKEQKIRQKLVEDGKLDAVIQLPNNVFYHTRLATVVMVFRHDQKPESVTFIDASESGQKFKTMTLITPEDIKELIPLYYVPNLQDKSKVQVVSLEKLRETNYNLNPSAYFSKKLFQGCLKEEYNQMLYWQQKRKNAMENVDRLFGELGLDLEEKGERGDGEEG